jgi:hypothetical protein
MVERYNIYPYDQYSTDDRTSPTGAWVRYEDYEALEAQLATTPSPEAVVKAALKWAVRKIEDESNHQNDLWIDACEHVAFEIGFAANDPATIAAIIKTAGEEVKE